MLYVDKRFCLNDKIISSLFNATNKRSLPNNRVHNLFLEIAFALLPLDPKGKGGR